MSCTVFKYNIDSAFGPDGQKISAPERFLPIKVELQAGDVFLWALVDPEDALVTRTVNIFGTGHTMPFNWDYWLDKHIGTFFEADAALVWHVFIGEPE